MRRATWRLAAILLSTSVVLACGKSRQNGEAPGPEAAEATTGDIGSGGSGGDAGTDADTGAEIPLCDGSEGLRFSVVVISGNVLPAELVRWELGARFLFIQGNCQYWVSGPETPSRWQHYHTGTLTELERTTVEDAFLWGQWQREELVGHWLRGQGEFDVPSKAFQSSEGEIICDGGCGAESNPAEVFQIRDAEQPMVDQLWNSSAPYSGALRVQATVDRGSLSRFEPAIWPLTWSLSEIVVEPEEEAYLQPGMSTLVSDPEEASALRAIWDDYDATIPQWKSLGPIPFEDPQAPGVVFAVVMRDTLPFEEDNGLVTLPW